MMDKISEIRASVIVANHGSEPFFAKDLGLNSSDIQRLKSWYFIEETGNKRQEFINVYGNHYISVQAKEWCLRRNTRKDWIHDSVRRSVSAVYELANLLKESGF
jgi:hypothetical protein